jgi:hypothetical protein
MKVTDLKLILSLFVFVLLLNFTILIEGQYLPDEDGIILDKVFTVSENQPYHEIIQLGDPFNRSFALNKYYNESLWIGFHKSTLVIESSTNSVFYFYLIGNESYPLILNRTHYDELIELGDYYNESTTENETINIEYQSRVPAIVEFAIRSNTSSEPNHYGLYSKGTTLYPYSQAIPSDLDLPWITNHEGKKIPPFPSEVEGDKGNIFRLIIFYEGKGEGQVRLKFDYSELPRFIWHQTTNSTSLQETKIDKIALFSLLFVLSTQKLRRRFIK